MQIALSVANAALRRSLVRALTTQGHRVRVLLSGAAEPSTQPAAQVEPWTINDDDPRSAYDAVAECEVAIVVDPALSGTAAGPSGEASRSPDLVDAAAQAGVRRVVRVCPRNPARHMAEPQRGDQQPPPIFPREWIALRAAPVYGVGDDPITLFLLMMRALPAVPIVAATHIGQPLWYEDLARAISASVSLPAAAINRVVDVAGPEAVTQQQLYDHVATLIDRRPLRIPIPEFLASHGARLAEALSMPVPFEASHLAFAAADETELHSGQNGLASVFGISGTGLEAGLTRLINELEELLPSTGVGSTEVKRFAADIRGSRYNAIELLRQFRLRFKALMPVEVGIEPVAPQSSLEKGAVITMALPGRGHVQVRVEEVTDDYAVLATLRGHALAGAVRFSTTQSPDGVRFEVTTCDAAANGIDWITLTLGGARIQDAHWTKLVQNVVKLAGGTVDGVESHGRTLTGEEIRNAESWIEAAIGKRRASERRTTSRAS